MSFDDYANHIYQKHRLCVAIAVLKTKPTDLTSTEYIKLLQSKMAEKMEDDDVTVCSEDFMMSDDDSSVNILKDFVEEFAFENAGRQNDIEGQSISKIHEQTQITNFNTQSQIEPNIDQDATYYNNNHTTTNITDPENVEKYPKNNNKDVATKINNNLPNNKELNVPIDSTIDTQKTILYSVHGFTQNYTHYSPSQNDILIPNKYLYRTNENKNETTLNTKNDITNAVNDVILVNSNTLNNTKTARILTDSHKDRQRKEISEDIVSESILANQNVLFSQNLDDNEINLTGNEKFSTTLFVDDYFNEIHKLDNEFNLNEKNTNTILNFELTQASQNIIANVNSENHSYFSQDNCNNLDTNQHNSHKTQKLEINNLESFPSTELNNLNLIENTELNNLDSIQNTELNNLNSIQNMDTGKYINEIPIQNTQDFGPNSSQQKEIAQFEIEEEELPTSEVIPYKVLEELNKIKTFLKRRDRRMSCDGYSTDSGYRSDSQLKSSNRSALQLSGMSINQSAYCLFNHLMQCPLVGTTRKITSEIAQTLGQLIDRLHEEESYPTFLEELLDTLDILLRQVYKGQSSDHSEFLKKDEFIQRILLLNKSIHIQSHSIDKLTDILTKFHEKITDINVTYELTNIDEVENLSYLFHILEILIKRYIKNKNMSSQNSQTSQSQEEKILNKSSITDIWRKKWNPNFKENNVGSRENRCVLKNCSEILNKIIVDCVNSYSLVAFSALKCFNTMQS